LDIADIFQIILFFLGYWAIVFAHGRGFWRGLICLLITICLSVAFVSKYLKAESNYLFFSESLILVIAPFLLLGFTIYYSIWISHAIKIHGTKEQAFSVLVADPIAAFSSACERIPQGAMTASKSLAVAAKNFSGSALDFLLSLLVLILVGGCIYLLIVNPIVTIIILLSLILLVLVLK
jgi:hypothetical protein